MSDEKVQKVLAQHGLGSRREMERWVAEGRVKINGKLATTGDRVKEDDQIHVDNKIIKRKEHKTRVLIYNKPSGVICTRHDPEGRTTIFDQLPEARKGRWVNIGRLDINTSGLLLLTNDGELANRMMHPKYEIEREYAVRVMGQVSDETIKRLETGVELEDGLAKFVTICYIGGEGINKWFHVALKEGRNREVRRLWEAVGHKVSRLHRIRYGPITLSRQLRQGQYEELDQNTLDVMQKAVGLETRELDEPTTTRRTGKKTARKDPTRGSSRGKNPAGKRPIKKRRK